MSDAGTLDELERERAGLQKLLRALNGVLSELPEGCVSARSLTPLASALEGRLEVLQRPARRPHRACRQRRSHSV